MGAEIALGRRIRVAGAVQGVGFRPFVYRLARRQGVNGRVRNDCAGVTIDAFAREGALRDFVTELEANAPDAATIRAIDWSTIPYESLDVFTIEASDATAAREVSLPADLPTCRECLSELHCADDRRFAYPFTNCTNCGPRFTIALDIPYDRVATTMARFPLCGACRREYENPGDRRFHAEPIACPACGPRLELLDQAGRVETRSAPIRRAARILKDAGIVAIKSLGGFHLAADATSSKAVACLRLRKRRDEKPFAVMVRNVEAAERIARLDRCERELLESAPRPILLAAAREGSPIVPDVAPGNPLIGVMLAYTPLHHLLLEETGRPLVMTSGNVSDEPLAYRDEEALVRLRGIADCYLTHDRDIVSRCDDSVARVIGGLPTVLRRSRGYVPHGLEVPRRFARPVLACGGHFKNACCFGIGSIAHLGPHVGDLETEAACSGFDEMVERMERFLDVRPEVVAHDLHPSYYSTRYALRRTGVVQVAVQHHHAHVASAMAEHGLTEPVLGVAFDGTGLGTDGTSWGGELLLADYEGFERIATVRPLRLIGGDRAIRYVWRTALALLEDAFGADLPIDALALFDAVDRKELTVARRALARHVAAPLSHGIGRYFDAIGALVLARPQARYDGQVAIDLNLVARAAERNHYPYEISDATSPWTLDFRRTTREIVRDLVDGAAAELISARFHNTLVEGTRDLVDRALRAHGDRTVVLTGGCFQNALLAERLESSLAGRAEVRRHSKVPPGDGGLALGQALVANAVLEAGGRPP